VIGGDHPVWGTLGDLTTAEKLVFVYYVARADRTGHTWPKLSTVAADLNVNYGSVLRAVRMLVKTGRLVPAGKGPGPVNHAANRYRIVVPK
jgi:hypothetical protein